MFQAARYAVNELNSAGGLLGREITLLEIDNKSDTKKSARAARIVAAKGVKCVIGPMISSHAIASASVLQEMGIPMIATAATAPRVTEIGDYIFRSCFTDAFQGQALAYFARHQLKAGKAAVLMQADENYSISLARNFVSAFEKLGGTVPFLAEYTAGDMHFHESLDRIKLQHADVLVLPGYAQDVGRIIGQARELDITLPIIGGDAWSNRVQEFTDPGNLEHCYMVRHWHRSASNDLSRRFLAGYEATYGPMRMDVGALTYDAVLLYATAVRKAGSFRSVEVRDALRGISVRGVTGIIAFDHQGDPEKSALITTYEEGYSRFFMVLEP